MLSGFISALYASLSLFPPFSPINRLCPSTFLSPQYVPIVTQYMYLNLFPRLFSCGLFLPKQSSLFVLSTIASHILVPQFVNCFTSSICSVVNFLFAAYYIYYLNFSLTFCILNLTIVQRSSHKTVWGFNF